MCFRHHLPSLGRAGRLGPTHAGRCRTSWRARTAGASTKSWVSAPHVVDTTSSWCAHEQLPEQSDCAGSTAGASTAATATCLVRAGRTPWIRPFAQIGDLSGDPAVEAQPIGSSIINTASRDANPVRALNASQNVHPQSGPMDSAPLEQPASLQPAETRAVNEAPKTITSSVNNNVASAQIANIPAIETKVERDFANDSRPILSNAKASPNFSTKAVRSITARQSNASLVSQNLTSPRTVTDRNEISHSHPSVKEVQWRDEAATSLLVPAASKIMHAVQLAKTVQPHAVIASSTTSTGKDSVQITIGRVEVRAVTGGECPAARAAKPTTPRLSLDDYLRERSGGRP